MNIIEFFFCDLWHFICLLLVCYVLSPKIKIEIDNSTCDRDNKEEDPQ